VERHGNPALTTIKSVIAAISVLVLLATGYGWTTLRDLNNGLLKTKVIELHAADGATDILLVGNDSRVDAKGNPLPKQVLAELRAGDNEGELTDTLILLRIPNDGKRAVAISLPRDAYVNIPGGYGKHKINSAYGRAKNATAAKLREKGQADQETIERESVLDGRKTLVKTIESLTGAGIDHYAEVNLLGFYDITNAVGGVEVCLKRPVREPKSGANFPAGPQRISGGAALAFVRQRENLPRGDLDRIVRQQVFLGALADQVLAAGTLANPGKLRGLIDSLQRSVVLDQDWDIFRFAQQVRGIAAGNVEFVTIPIAGEERVDGDGAVLNADPRTVREFVSGMTSAPAPAPATSNADSIANAKVTVDVRNASGAGGLAGRVLDELAARGFTRGEAANAAMRTSSLVRHAPGDQDAGRRVAEALGGLPVEPDSNLAAGHVRVFLGEDYRGPGVQQLSGGPLVRLDGAPHAQQPNPEPPITAGNVPCVD
jgi:LCP family protein required for cell wall assembly